MGACAPKFKFEFFALALTGSAQNPLCERVSPVSPLLAARDEFEFILAFSLEEAPTFGRGSSLEAKTVNSPYLPTVLSSVIRRHSGMKACPDL